MHTSVNKSVTVQASNITNSHELHEFWKKIYEVAGYPDRPEVRVTFAEPLSLSVTFSIL